MHEAPTRSVADLLNDSCDCVVMDEALLDKALSQDGGHVRAAELFPAAPQLFSKTAVFVDVRAGEAMRALVAAVERVVQLPAYQANALADAHPHARLPCAAQGAFMGFDFHLTEAKPSLIEINTNAGGGLINALLRRAQRHDCEFLTQHVVDDEGDHARLFFAMMESEWQRARGARVLRSVAVVDDEPEQQFLYPEFKLFVQLCQTRGIHAQVCDARALSVRDGALYVGDQAIDLVYNRLTDFMLEQPSHAALLQAYREDAAVVTPNPRAHALYADKRRLCTLTNPSVLRSMGAAEPDIALLSELIPTTREVRDCDRELLWRERKTLFFKPHSGYASKAAYRGDKLTKGVFEQLLAGQYVAQRLVPPSSRITCVGEERKALKVDIRCFTYAGQVQLTCARLYSGQTTNFRTHGGGFAPVYETRL